MTVVKGPSSKATHSTGFDTKTVFIVSVDTDKQMAQCRDRVGATCSVPTNILPGKSYIAPQPGETWLIDRVTGKWSFARIIDYTPVGPFVPEVGSGGGGALDTLVWSKSTNIAVAESTHAITTTGTDSNVTLGPVGFYSAHIRFEFAIPSNPLKLYDVLIEGTDQFGIVAHEVIWAGNVTAGAHMEGTFFYQSGTPTSTPNTTIAIAPLAGAFSVVDCSSGSTVSPSAWTVVVFYDITYMAPA